LLILSILFTDSIYISILLENMSLLSDQFTPEQKITPMSH